MTLSQLGEEYLQQSVTVKQQIALLRPQLEALHGLELYRLRRKIMKLYSIARELKETGTYLINYYEED